MTSSPELAILRHLAARTTASAAEIGISCRMTAAEVRARLVMLESMRLVAGRHDPDARLTRPLARPLQFIAMDCTPMQPSERPHRYEARYGISYAVPPAETLPTALAGPHRRGETVHRLVPVANPVISKAYLGGGVPVPGTWGRSIAASWPIGRLEEKSSDAPS